jgi:hypothetical protein
MKRTLIATLLCLFAAREPAVADQVIADDLIVNGGSLCVGVDCVNGESFGFDTIRLKENNLRISFDDTSSTGSFPANDWEITINDSTNGGASYFGITDRATGRRVATFSAGAPSNSLFVGSNGNVGFGTAAPVVELQTVDGDTPTLRLQQDGSLGFLPQTWDVASNEANFFIRDVTNGSRLVFRIKPNAPADSIFVASPTGDVGMGTASPTSPVHVFRADGTAKVLAQDTQVPANPGIPQVMFELRRPGAVRFDLVDESNGTDWVFQNRLDAFDITKAGTGVQEFKLQSGGNLIIQGMLTQGSDRARKTGITAVNASEVLAKLTTLPISQWAYKHEPTVHHIGPVAQDFKAAFDLGVDDKHLAPGDLAGVAVVGVQALHRSVQELSQEVQVRDEKIAQEDAEIAALKQRLAMLEEMVSRIVAHQTSQTAQR